MQIDSGRYAGAFFLSMNPSGVRLQQFLVSMAQGLQRVEGRQVFTLQA